MLSDRTRMPLALWFTACGLFARHGRDPGAEPTAGSGDRLVPRCSWQLLASPLQVTGLV